VLSPAVPRREHAGQVVGRRISATFKGKRAFIPRKIMTNHKKGFDRVRKVIRVIWAIAGLSFFIWLFSSYQSRGFPPSVLQSDELISVSQNGKDIRFIPKENKRSTGFIFYPGSMVDPKAYAPMARQLAENGFTIYIVELPIRSASLPGQEADLMAYTRQIMDTDHSVRRWVLGGHSRGAAIASRFVSYNRGLFSGLILIGTSHPKDAEFDLSNSGLPVMKIYATHDGLASVPEVKETSKFLPDNTLWVRIEGGNHSQFGYTGTLLGDNHAEISLIEQQDLTISAVLSMLKDVDE
jgi:hypothetical protein